MTILTYDEVVQGRRMQSPVVREHARIGDDQVIMICVAMGDPDESFPANAVETKRKSVDEAANFVGFKG